MFSYDLHFLLPAKNPSSLHVRAHAHTHTGLLLTSKGAWCVKGETREAETDTLLLISEHSLGRQEVLVQPFKNKGIGPQG